MALTRILILLFLATMTNLCCHGYRLGPPNDPETCTDMFPRLHASDARDDEPPFTFTLSQSKYKPGDVITVFLDSKKNPENTKEWFMEGVFIQARRVTSDCDNVVLPGTFQVPKNDSFLKTMNCFGRPNNSIGHYSHFHIYNRTFTWTAPDMAVGHIYLRATVARNQEKFWTNVFSDYIMDASSSSTKLERCPVRTKDKVSSAMSVYANMFLLLTLLVSQSYIIC